MYVSAGILGLVGLAATSPLGERQVVPHYPPTSVSKGFHLVVNVTDLSKDFSPSIQNTYITSIHVGAGLALVGQHASADHGRIFYQNGTVTENKYRKSNILTDSGTPPFPAGLKLVSDDNSDTVSTAHIDGGSGDAGIGLTVFPEPYSFLYPGTWVACTESLPYYQCKNFIVFKQAKLSVDENGVIDKHIPKGCAAVRLLPECTQLNDLPGNAQSSHSFALDSHCYPSVKSLDWSKYGP